MPFRIKSIDTNFDTFEKFQEISGLKVNFDKTEIFPLGPIKDIAILLYAK